MIDDSQKLDRGYLKNPSSNRMLCSGNGEHLKRRQLSILELLRWSIPFYDTQEKGYASQ